MNTLYYGDNLEILREYVLDESVDLVYLDPPFNSKQAYNVIFRDKDGYFPPSQIEAFDDTWHWTDASEEVLLELSKPQYSPELFQMLTAFKSFLGTSDMMAYLAMMAMRLWEMHRVLKRTGSIYLHCDPTASHYLKILLDRVFGAKNYQNEIVWWYETGGIPRKDFSRKHDIIFRYTKTDKYYFQAKEVMEKRSDEVLRRIATGVPTATRSKGQFRHPCDVWKIPSINAMAKERLGYPTQKPEALLDRIIRASSNNDNVILDPFCGCGTTIAVAEKLGRKWIGIDITILAVNLIEKRLRDHFPDIKYNVVGIPTDFASAERLTSTREGKFLFERWFVTALGGQPYKSSGGGDAGIDGFLYARDLKRQTHRVIISVKGGAYGPAAVRDLKGTVERENAFAGLLLALNPPSTEAKAEAASAGRVELPGVARSYPKLQILTVEDYFAGLRPDLPDTSETLKKAARIKREKGKEEKLPLD